jgi:hypothetical protein
MPSKLICNLREMSHLSEVLIQHDDGPPVKLRMVKSVNFMADAEGPPTVELVMYAPDTALEVAISDRTAEAIAYHERSKLLGFLSTTDRERLAELRNGLQRALEAGMGLGLWAATAGCIDVLSKIVAEFARQQKELEESGF